MKLYVTELFCFWLFSLCIYGCTETTFEKKKPKEYYPSDNVEPSTKNFTTDIRNRLREFMWNLENQRTDWNTKCEQFMRKLEEISSSPEEEQILLELLTESAEWRPKYIWAFLWHELGRDQDRLAIFRRHYEKYYPTADSESFDVEIKESPPALSTDIPPLKPGEMVRIPTHKTGTIIVAIKNRTHRALFLDIEWYYMDGIGSSSHVFDSGKEMVLVVPGSGGGCWCRFTKEEPGYFVPYVVRILNRTSRQLFKVYVSHEGLEEIVRGRQG